MIRIKVEYDAYNRRFKLIDREFGSILEDGTTYELTLPFLLPNLCEDELISVSGGYTSPSLTTPQLP
jgi:hypothetical protein